MLFVSRFAVLSNFLYAMRDDAKKSFSLNQVGMDGQMDGSIRPFSFFSF